MCDIFVQFWYLGDVGFAKWVWKHYFCFNFLKCWKGLASTLFQMFGRIHLRSYLLLDFVCWELVYYWFNFITSILVCSYFLFLPISFLRECTFLGICPFLQGCPSYYHTVIYICIYLCYICIYLCIYIYAYYIYSNLLNNHLYFCSINYNISFFILFAWAFPFTWWDLVEVYRFYLSFKEIT